MTATPFLQGFLWLNALTPLSSPATQVLFIFCSPGPGLQEFSKASRPQEGVKKLTWESMGQVEVTSSSPALQNPKPALLGPELV